MRKQSPEELPRISRRHNQHIAGPKHLSAQPLLSEVRCPGRSTNIADYPEFFPADLTIPVIKECVRPDGTHDDIAGVDRCERISQIIFPNGFKEVVLGHIRIM